MPPWNFSLTTYPDKCDFFPSIETFWSRNRCLHSKAHIKWSKYTVLSLSAVWNPCPSYQPSLQGKKFVPSAKYHGTVVFKRLSCLSTYVPHCPIHTTASLLTFLFDGFRAFSMACQNQWEISRARLSNSVKRCRTRLIDLQC